MDKFLKPAVNIARPSIGMANAAKNQIPEVGHATANILRSISGRKSCSLTEMRENRLRLKFLQF